MTRTNKTRFIEWHKNINVSVDQMQLFLIINKNGIKINADVNAKNYLIKEHTIKDLFGILVTVNASVINLVISVTIQTMNCKCKKNIADKLIDECTETIEVTKLVNITFT